MRSPFPGMDPYLEGHLWTSCHAFLATEIAKELTPRLRPKYIALPERKYITAAAEDILISAPRVYPDVGVHRAKALGASRPQTALLEPPVKMRTQVTISAPHFHILVRDVERRRLVTAIELLSPSNKHGPGRAQYLRKRQRFLRSSAHLLEIDLHHRGKRAPMLDPYPAGAYFVLLCRARRRLLTEVWPIAIDQPLPPVPVPLLRGDDDVPLDLQKVFTRVYEDGGFDLVINYRKPPDVELPSDEAAWVDQHLRHVGMRK